MKLAIASYPKQRISHSVLLFSWVLAAMFITLATTQLITYEKFFPIMQNYQVLDGAFGKVLASILVICEVFALPFVLRMKVSRLFRYVSLFCAHIAGAIWVFLGVWAIYYHPPTTGAGIFGGIFHHIPAEISLFLGLLLIGSVIRLHRLLVRDLG